jgi:chromosome segregation ATPase
LNTEKLLYKSTELAQVNAKNRQLYETLISHQTFLESISDKMAVFGNLRNLKEDVREEKSKNELLTSELDILRTKFDQERHELKAMHGKIYDLQEEYRRVTVELEVEKQEKISLRNEYEKLIKEHDVVKSQVDDMEYEVRTCRDKLSYVVDLKNQVQGLNKFIQDLQDENMILRNSAKQVNFIENQEMNDNDLSTVIDRPETPMQKLYGDPEKQFSKSPQKSPEFFSKGLNAKVVRNGHAGVTPKRFEQTPKIPIIRMNTSRGVDAIHSWIEMEEPKLKSEAPTFIIEEAEKAKITLAEFTNYIHDLEIS